MTSRKYRETSAARHDRGQARQRRRRSTLLLVLGFGALGVGIGLIGAFNTSLPVAVCILIGLLISAGVLFGLRRNFFRGDGNDYTHI